MDAATASKSIQPVFLTVEANQDAHLQVWKTVGSSTPQLLWPEKETGQISLKMTAGQRQHIPLPMESGPVTLTARLSLVPFGPTTRQETAMFDRLSPNQLQESITANNQTGSQEQRHLHRQPRSIHNRSDRRQYYPRPVGGHCLKPLEQHFGGNAREMRFQRAGAVIAAVTDCMTETDHL